MTDEKIREQVAEAIYEALGFNYAGRMIDIHGKPMGAWRDVLAAADAAILAYVPARADRAWRAHDWEYYDKDGKRRLAGTPERAEFLIASGIKITALYVSLPVTAPTGGG